VQLIAGLLVQVPMLLAEGIVLPRNSIVENILSITSHAVVVMMELFLLLAGQLEAGTALSEPNPSDMTASDALQLIAVVSNWLFVFIVVVFTLYTLVGPRSDTAQSSGQDHAKVSLSGNSATAVRTSGQPNPSSKPAAPSA